MALRCAFGYILWFELIVTYQLYISSPKFCAQVRLALTKAHFACVVLVQSTLSGEWFELLNTKPDNF